MIGQIIRSGTQAIVGVVLASSFAAAQVVDLVYDPSTGHAQMVTNGLELVTFNLQNEEGGDDFLIENADFSDFPEGLTDNSPTNFGWFSLVGFTGEANLGNIFPTGLESVTDVASFLTNRLYGLQPPNGGGELNLVVVSEPTPLGLDDINNLLVQVRTGDNNPEFDINADTLVNVDDIVALVTRPDKLNTYIGDANLDGEFSSSDIVDLFAAGEYEDGVAQNSRWETGDFNGDAEFDSGDIVFSFAEGGYELGPRDAVVPEPASQLLMLVAFCLCVPKLQALRR